MIVGIKAIPGLYLRRIWFVICMKIKNVYLFILMHKYTF
jgi:hypothetical protein